MMVPDRVDLDSSAQRLVRLLALLESDGGARGGELERIREVDPHAAEVLERLLARGVKGWAEGLLREGETPASWDRAAGNWVGAYQIDRVLGRGGMGTVYLAHRRAPFRQEVALKLMRPGLPAHLVSRFHAERQLLASLAHPGIVHLIDGGDEADGAPYLVMEYVPGVHLTTYCKNHHATVEDRVRLVHAVAEALAFAHSRGVVHRDLKPSNILVGEDGRPRIVDFGLAKLAAALDGSAQALTITAMPCVGTPAYMAPERLEAGPGRDDPAVDVYSLGVILFLLLTDRLPFTGVESVEGWGRVIREDAPKLRRIVRSLPRDLETITARALAREPGDRFQNADELAEELRRYLAGEPLGIRPPTNTQRLARWAGRHRRPLMAWGMSTGIVLLASVAMLAVWNRDLQRKRDALRGTMRPLWMASTQLLESLPTNDPAVVSFYEKLSEWFEAARDQAPSGIDDPALDRQVAVMHRHLAAARQDTGNADKALSLLDRSLSLLRPLPPKVADPVIRAWTEFDLFRTLKERANSLRTLKKYPEALNDTDEALHVIQTLAGRFPSEPARLEAEAHLHLSRGSIFYDMGRFADMEREQIRALELAERGVEQAGDDAAVPEVNTLCLARRLVAGAVADPAEKERLLRGACEAAERVRGMAGDVWYVNNSYANSMIDLGRFLLERDRADEALPYLETALPVVDQLLRERPGFATYMAMRRDVLQSLDRCRRAPVASASGPDR